MPQNPHVRTIRLFNPAVDLAVDNADPRRVRKRRPPVNPAEGLLNDDDDDVLVGGGSAARPPAGVSENPGYTRLENSDDSAGSAPAASDPASASKPIGAPAADTGAADRSDKFESSVLGEVPEMIEGDFPEPVDL